MPFIQEYECTDGHRFEHMHMGSRSSVPAYLPCTVGALAATADDAAAIIVKGGCGNPASPCISAPGAIQTIVKGNGDFATRENERLTKRSRAHDRTRNEKDRKRDLMERKLRAGFPVNPIRGL